MIDYAALVAPVSDTEPCGPDLDLSGDSQYLNFVVGTEQSLPKSYFEHTTASGEKTVFDPKSIDPEAFFTTAMPLLAQTRDLRLLALLAKIAILGRDLPSFQSCLRAMADLLTSHWSEVHPQGEGGDFGYRAVAVEAIDSLPTVVFPLQFQPLFQNRRYGSLSFRGLQIARGEVAAQESEETVDIGQVDRLTEECDLDHLRSMNSAFLDMLASVAQLQKLWSENTNNPSTLSFPGLTATLSGISRWLKSVLEQRDPQSTADEAAALDDDAADGSGGEPATGGEPASTLNRIETAATATQALQAVESYFAAIEPSSPALLLVRQAQQMVGKSFVDLMRMMVPNHMEAANLRIGRDRFFDLPIERVAELTAASTSDAASEQDGETTAFSVATRAQALGLMERVAAYFRSAEPSNPIPLLIDKARDLAQRDFIGVLRDMLPDDALATSTTKRD